MCRTLQFIVLFSVTAWGTSCGSVTPDPPQCETATDCVASGSQCGVGSCFEGKCLFTPDESCCGNGVLDEGEECDDGNTANGDDCPSTCSTAVCGDGEVGGGEECDAGDANANSPDAPCRSDCTLPSCGDGILDTEGGEECDDGNDLDTDGCLTTCSNASCGDGFVQVEVEGCDQGVENSDEPDASCRTDCQEARCGDGITDPEGNETCDDGNDVDTDNCLHNCLEATCGDGLVNVGVEECDQGENNSDEPNAGCRTNCKEAGCGDGIIDNSLNESCDDGNESNNDDCIENCVAASCGDSFVHEGVEECDDGNDFDTDGCVAGCKDAVCGDGLLYLGVEECDLGQVNNSDLSNSACRTTCVLPFCGDGIVDNLAPLNEICDDGNGENNDGCVTECVEATCGDGFVRTVGAAGELEECDEAEANADIPDAPCRTGCILPQCGDNIVDPGLDEQCDDGNVGGGDSDPCANQSCEWQKFRVPMSLSAEARSIAASLDDGGNVGFVWTALAEGTGYRYIYSTLLNPKLHPYTVNQGTQPVPTGIGKLVSTSETASLSDTVLVTPSAAGFVIGWKDFSDEFCLKKLNAAEEDAPLKVIAQTYWILGMAKAPSELALATENGGDFLLAGWVDSGRDDCSIYTNNGVCGEDSCPNANDCTDCNNCNLGIATVVRVDAWNLDVVGTLPDRNLASPLTGNVENLSFCTDVQGHAEGVTATLRDPLNNYQSIYTRDYDSESADGPYFPEENQSTYFTDIPTSLTHVKAGRCLESENKRLILLPTDHLIGDDPIYVSYKDNNTEISGVFAFEGPGFSESGSTLHTIQGSPDNLVAVMTSSIGNGGLELAGSYFTPDDFVGEGIDSLTLFDADPDDNTDTIHETATVVVYPDHSRALFVWVQDGVIWGRVHPWGSQ